MSYEDAAFKQRVERHLETEKVRQTLVKSTAHPITPAGNSASIGGWWAMTFSATTAFFEYTWYSRLPMLVHKSVHCKFGAVTSAAALGRCRLRLVGPSTDLITDEISLPANTTAAYEFNWLHGHELWKQDYYDLGIQVKVDSLGGGDSITIFSPYGGSMIQRVPINATPNGL